MIHGWDLPIRVGWNHERMLFSLGSDEAILALAGALASLEIFGIIYLAIAVSHLRERMARMEGRQKERKGL